MLKLLHDKILVKPDVRELSTIIHVENKETPNMGTVVAVGPGKRLPNGRREEMPIEVGARVRFGTMSKNRDDEYLHYHPYEECGVKYLIMSWADVAFEESHV